MHRQTGGLHSTERLCSVRLGLVLMLVSGRCADAPINHTPRNQQEQRMQLTSLTSIGSTTAPLPYTHG